MSNDPRQQEGVVPAGHIQARFKPLAESRSIGEALRHPEMISRFKMAVPKHLSPDRMLRVMAMAVQRTPKLAECDLMSLLGAMLGLASLGLEPNTPLGLAYLIPFEKRGRVNGEWVTIGTEVQVVIGYRGYIDLMRRAGSMQSLHADVVYEGDEFSFEYGSNMHLKHIPRGEREGRKPLWAYSFAKLTDGQAFEVLPYAQVMKIRNNSQGYQSAERGRQRNPRAFDSNPWVAFEHEMAAKTMIRRIAKYMPMTIELANAATLDSLSEVGKANFASLTTAPMEDLADMGAIAHDGPPIWDSSSFAPPGDDEPVVVGETTVVMADTAAKPRNTRPRAAQAEKKEPAAEPKAADPTEPNSPPVGKPVAGDAGNGGGEAPGVAPYAPVEPAAATAFPQAEEPPEADPSDPGADEENKDPLGELPFG